MRALVHLRGFVRAFRRGGGRRPRHSGDALGRAAKDGLHMAGSRSSAVFSGSQAAYDQVADGAEDYDRSFERD